MKVLIKQATIIDAASPFHGKVKDILIIDGIIQSINDNINESVDTTINDKNICVSIGWVDMFANFCDPGFEYKETIESGAKSAMTGGFTDVLIIPNTNPVIHNKSQIEYIVQKSKGSLVNVYPIGAITKNAEGKELAEMYDMKNAGAVAFGDGTHSVQSSGLLLKALQYVLPFDGTIIQLPNDHSISPNGVMNEGIVSTQLGLPGKPSIAEELMIARDIELAQYTNSKIHFTGVTSPKSIDLISKAKANGIKVTCSVTPHHLNFCDDDLIDYNSNLKVTPPLRTKTEMLALRDALQKGKIDCIASHHLPQNTDSKLCEFEYAKDGTIGLETMFGATISAGISVESFVDMQTKKARTILGLSIPEIKEGTPACLTIFNTEGSCVYEASMIQSKSKNSAFIGKELKGKVIGVINNNQLHIN